MSSQLPHLTACRAADRDAQSAGYWKGPVTGGNLFLNIIGTGIGSMLKKFPRWKGAIFQAGGFTERQA